MAESRQNVSTASETMDTLLEISKILNTGLDSETMAICLRLCDSGVNPEALAFIIKELRKETATFRAAENFSQTS